MHLHVFRMSINLTNFVVSDNVDIIEQLQSKISQLEDKTAQFQAGKEYSMI